MSTRSFCTLLDIQQHLPPHNKGDRFNDAAIGKVIEPARTPVHPHAEGEPCGLPVEIVEEEGLISAEVSLQIGIVWFSWLAGACVYDA